MTDITLKLPPEFLATIVAALREIPYKHAAPVLDLIQAQVSAAKSDAVPGGRPL